MKVENKRSVGLDTPTNLYTHVHYRCHLLQKKTSFVGQFFHLLCLLIDGIHLLLLHTLRASHTCSTQQSQNSNSLDYVDLRSQTFHLSRAVSFSLVLFACSSELDITTAQSDRDTQYTVAATYIRLHLEHVHMYICTFQSGSVCVNGSTEMLQLCSLHLQLLFPVSQRQLLQFLIVLEGERWDVWNKVWHRVVALAYPIYYSPSSSKEVQQEGVGVQLNSGHFTE